MSRDQEQKPQAVPNAAAPIQRKHADQGGLQQSVNELGAKPIQRKADGPSARQQSLGEMGNVIQRRQSGEAEQSDDVQKTAKAGVKGPGEAMPHADKIQQSFGKHDVSGVKAHMGDEAAGANEALGAEAYATGNSVAFNKKPDLHTAAHEAAHVVQQRAGKVAGGLGAANDAHEKQADKVADKVVAGESAEALLTETAGAPQAEAGAPGGAAPVQRKLVDNVKSKALAPYTHTLGKSEYPAENPTPGIEAFSGPLSTRIVHTPSGALGSDLQPVADEIGRPEHGMPDDVWSVEIPKRYPDVMNKNAFTLGLGSDKSFELINAPHTVKTYFKNVMYPHEAGGPWTVSGSNPDYKRQSENDRVKTFFNDGIGCNTISGVLSGGQQKLVTKYDGSLFGRWTSKDPTIKNLYTDVLGSKPESDAFQTALAPTGTEGVTGWYDVARGSGFNGKTAAWLDDTMHKDDVQVNTLRSLQQFHKQGATKANDDMDDVVDAIRAKIHDKKTSATDRTLLENRILDSGVAKNVKVADNAVKDDADTNPDSADANFDRMRIAGKVLARRELVPHLQHSFNPLAYAKAYPIDFGKTLGDDMGTFVIQEAVDAEKRTLAFLETGLDAQTLDPADANAKKQGQGIEAQSNANALGSARLGAVEAIREGSQSIGTGASSITAHVMAIQSLIAVQKNNSTGNLMIKAIGTAANTGISDTQGLLFKDYKALKAAAATLQQDGDKRGIHVDSFADVMDSYTTKLDLAALRKTTNAVDTASGKEASIKVIQAAAYAQALSAKTESNVAYKSAHDRYSSDFIENLNGKFDEKLGGSKWAPMGMMALNAAKELIDFRAALKLLHGAKAAVGPAVGVALVALDAILTIRDWWAKAKINKAKSKMTADFKSTMDAGEKTTLNKIQSNTSDEVKMISKGEIRPVEGMRQYADQLGDGKQGATPPKPIDFDKLSRAELDELYESMLANPGESHATLYSGYLGGIGVTGNDMWKKFEKEIDELPNVWK